MSGDPFGGRAEITADEWLAVVGHTDDPARPLVVPQDAVLSPTTSPTTSQPKQRATSTTARLRGIRESAFRDAVVGAATYLGWRCYWTWNSKHSPSGFPDLFMVRGSRAVAAELKIWPNKPTLAQLEWLAALAEAGIETYVWTLDTLDRVWAEIERILK